MSRRLISDMATDVRHANDDLFTDNQSFLDVSLGMLRSGVPDPVLADLRCGCGSAEIVALKPGQNAGDGLDQNPFTSDEVVSDPVHDIGWCARCHQAAFPALRREATNA